MQGAQAGHSSSTWLANHCGGGGQFPVADAMTVRHLIHPVFAVAEGAQPITDWYTKIHDEITAADKALAESHSSFKQHWRLICYKNSAGAWTQPFIDFAVVDQAADVNWGGDGNISCVEAEAWLKTSGHGYRDAHRRYLFFFDPSIVSVPQVDNHPEEDCVANGHAENDEGDTTPGIGNKNNGVAGYTMVHANDWGAAGTTNLSVATLGMEFYHSLGAVRSGAPGEAAAGHTNDDPDILNISYFDDPATIRKTCTPTITYRDTYMDCGRDTYWAPSPSATPTAASYWLCTHWNLASDSLYLTPRAQRPAGCAAS